MFSFTGDGTYMMANSEMATAAMMGVSFTVIVTDNRGFGCINRLQMGTGGAEFNNLLKDAVHETPSAIDFAAHAASMGATSVKVSSISELEEALAKRFDIKGPYVIVIDRSLSTHRMVVPGGVVPGSVRSEVNIRKAIAKANHPKNGVTELTHV